MIYNNIKYLRLLKCRLPIYSFMGLIVEENMNKTNHSTGYIRSITNPLQRGDQHTTTKYCLFLVKHFCLFLSEMIFYEFSYFILIYKVVIFACLDVCLIVCLFGCPSIIHAPLDRFVSNLYRTKLMFLVWLKKF